MGYKELSCGTPDYALGEKGGSGNGGNLNVNGSNGNGDGGCVFNSGVAEGGKGGNDNHPRPIIHMDHIIAMY